METLEMVYTKSNSISDITGVPTHILEYVEKIGNECEKKKGLYTVLTTLLYYKYLHPEQDIRYHQDKFKNGFSGRSFDTKYVTPILKKLELPAMAESGWLTRSLEQPYPYDNNYQGAIGILKEPFLKILEYVEKYSDHVILLDKTIVKEGKPKSVFQSDEFKEIFGTYAVV